MLIAIISVCAGLVGIYLCVAVLFSWILLIGVTSDLRQLNVKLGVREMIAVPFIMLYYALKHGLLWPHHTWLGYKDRKKQIAARLARNSWV